MTFAEIGTVFNRNHATVLNSIDWLYSRKTIPGYIPKAELTIRKGFAHCGYMAAYPKEYVEQIEAFIGGRK